MHYLKFIFALSILAVALVLSAPFARANPTVKFSVRIDETTTLLKEQDTVLLHGGFGEKGSPPVNDELNDLWSLPTTGSDFAEITVPSPPPARSKHAAVAANGKLYIFHGTQDATMRDDIWAYDPIANTWTQQPSDGTTKPAARVMAAAVTIGTDIYFFGGYAIPLTDAHMWKYDTTNGTWTQLAEHPDGEHGGHAMSVSDSQIIVYGGGDNEMWKYDPPSNTWTQMLPLTGTPPTFLYGAAFPLTSSQMPSSMFGIAGGYDASFDETASAYRFWRVAENTFSFAPLPSLAQTRTNFAAAGWDTGSGTFKIVAAGGAHENNPIDATEFFTVPICNIKPVKPTLVYPSDTAKIKAARPTLQWNSAECAAKYQVTVREGSAAGKIVFQAKNLHDVQVRTTALTRGKTYYWQVQAINANGLSKSAWRKFTVKL